MRANNDESEEVLTVVADEVDSWDALVDVLSGLRPDQVSPLAAARELELVYPFLHALTRGSLAGFILRVAVLETLVADGRSPLASSAIAEVLYWLKEPIREQVMRTLRGSGWLTHEPTAGYRISPGGQSLRISRHFKHASIALASPLEFLRYGQVASRIRVSSKFSLRPHLADLGFECGAILTWVK